MEGLRGFAVFLVFLVHLVTLTKPWISADASFLYFMTAVHTIGNSGVDMFFVLSGYLIYGSLISRRQQFLRFMSRRIQRIYPAFIAVFAVYLILSFGFPAESKIPNSAVDGILYLIQNFLLLPGLFPIQPMITVAWSLSYEMFYYCTIPAAITLLRLRERSAIWRTAFFLGVAFLMACYCAIFGGHIRLVMFISGIVLYEAVNDPRIQSPQSFFGYLVLPFGLLFTLLPLEGSVGSVLKVGVLFISFFTLFLYCLRSPSSCLSRFFTWTPMRWLGNMSYSYYLLHGLALKAAFLALATVMLPVAQYGPWLFWALLPTMFVLTIFPTAALYLLVERPLSLSPSSGRVVWLGAWAAERDK